MEHSAKRARGSTDGRKAVKSWARVFMKVLQVMMPVYNAMTRLLTTKENQKQLVSKVINQMAMDELIYTREYVNLQIRKKELEMDENDAASVSPATVGSRKDL